MFMSNNMQYEKNVSSVDFEVGEIVTNLNDVGKLFHREAAATANEQSPALVRVRFTSNMLLFAERSVLVG